MGRYTQTGPGQVLEPPVQAGDIGFLGVNNRLEPSQLPAGIAAEAVNRRFTRGVAECRKGIRKLNWLNRCVVTGDYRRKIEAFTVIYGVGKFKDPNGFEWDVIAADGAVFFTREQQFPATPVPVPVDILAPVTFTQAFNVLIMFRGEDEPELVLDDIGVGFREISTEEEDLLPNTISGTGTENPSDGTEGIPPATRGLFFQNRLWIPFNRDLVGVSDYLNYTRYSPTRSVCRINQGSSDALVTLGRFNETTLIAFKEQSIYAIGNLTGDLSTAFLYEITSEYGCKAARSVVAVGKDLWFLADKRGVCSITLTEQNKIQGVDVPVSQDIQGTIDRINWRYAAGAAAAFWQNRLYMAVPIDNAEVEKPTNLIAAGSAYLSGLGTSTLGIFEMSTVVGRVYRWTKGAEDSYLTQPIYIAHFATTNNIEVVPGRRYLYRPKAGGQLVNGGDTYLSTGGAVLFVAQGAFVTLTNNVLDSLTEINEVLLSENGTFTAAHAIFPSVGATHVTLVGTEFATVTARVSPIYRGINNAVLVYDFQAGKWSGHDESAALMVQDWSLTTVKGKQRLVFFGADGTMNLYEEGALDENIYEVADTVPIVYEPVVSTLTTRGYLFDTLEAKSALRALLAMAGLNPQYTIELVTEGVRESITLVADRTKNRLKYYRPHDQPDWDPSNVNGDFMRPYREDYAWVMGEDPDATYLDTKILPDSFQEIEEKIWTTGRGKYCQLRITNEVGMLTVFSTNLEAVTASKRHGVHA